ncbi:high mobility group protein Z [Edwardsiella piscicida]|uniref:High mobility group protein Z n=2 Tax=Edwardsiella piscicida TaxID=1263550 RepID=A0AAQ3H4T9_EDWPI|nr:hypothetical protein [Edwardsiella piscicida]ACY86330.1 hypothetical conserved protein [Edwardsiella tarda EIB202]ARD18330.1 high mobility group protein Z [Edwardsiella piscicida]EKS7768210.1 high mobility group protein Z [Edwardsiella piscicida]EKS7781629.1 high mobility group protein Z [Edwardsiella piscicida]EKS7794939.1 high mobility group protein Z [Edwardsiella piscicida]
MSLILAIGLMLTCYLLWLLAKLWRLSQRKARWQRAAMRYGRPPASPLRAGRRKQNKE